MARVQSATGARATEELLLRAIDEDQARIAADPSLLARTLHIVVPSKSLRDHISARISTRRGAAAGILVQTHLQLSFRLLEQDGSKPGRTHDALLELLIRRRADADPVLREVLGELQLGYRAVTASAGDLLHADLSLQQRDAIEDLLESLGKGGRAGRAAAVVRATLDSLADFEQLGLHSRDDLLREAGERLRDSKIESLGRGVIVHGYADATGVVSAFLDELLRHPEGLLLLDRPQDPAHPGREDLGVEFSRPFGQRLGETPRSAAQQEQAPAALEFFTAPGSRAEAREIARRIRAQLDAPGTVAPERIAVVARSLGSRALDLEQFFTDYGVPWQSSGSPGSVDPAGRRILAFLDLLRKGPSCTLERWFEARGEELTEWKKRLALNVLGATRLGQLPSLHHDEAFQDGALRLPHRRGFYVPEEGKSGVAFASRERFGVESLEQLKAEARAIGQHIESLDSVRSFGAHAQTTLQIAVEDLAWDDSSACFLRWQELLANYPDEFELSGEEFLTLLHDATDRAARARPDADGGGVRVLDLTQARGLCFEHIYVIGLNRGSFPPAAREDPLLPDDLRGRIRVLLSELKSKLDRSREERFLFAQLLSAAPSLTLSWWTSDDDGRAAPPSPFVQSLRLGADTTPPSAPATLEIEGAISTPRPLREELLQAALIAGDHRFEELLAANFESMRDTPVSFQSPLASAGAACRILREYDLAPVQSKDLGPWMGQLAARSDALADPRARDFHVTSLERLAGCPWQWFLQKVLGLEASPDPLDALPALDSRRVGSVVHGTLERIIEGVTGPGQGTQLVDLTGKGQRVPWPNRPTLESHSRAAAEKVLLEEGLVLPGLARALSIRAGVYLDECQRMLFSDSTPMALGSEIHAETRVVLADGREIRIPFRTDLVDRVDGHLRLLDFKTGSSFVTVVSESKKRERVLDAVSSGIHLQGMVYALAAGRVEGEGNPGCGAYLFLRPDEDERKRRVELQSDDGEILERFREVVSLLDLLKNRGLLPPRLIEPKSGNEPQRCKYCEVAGACVRGDTQHRQREEEWFKTQRELRDRGHELDLDNAALLAAWELPGGAS